MSRSFQQSLPPMPLANCSQVEPSRTNCSPEPEPRTKDSADAEAAAIFDDALTGARITSKEVAALVGVSESLVNRWRSPNYREAPSFTQMLRLPVSFHWHLNKALNRKYGFGRQALAQVLEGLGMLAAEQQP